jgi:hypothetical protein
MAHLSLSEALREAVMDTRQLFVHKFNRRFDGNKLWQVI